MPTQYTIYVGDNTPVPCSDYDRALEFYNKSIEMNPEKIHCIFNNYNGKEEEFYIPNN